MELDAPGRACASATTACELRGVEVDCRPMPDMLPVLATLGQFADGRDRASRNVEHVRLKESDRVVSMLQLNRMGGDVGGRRRRARRATASSGLTGAALS